MSGARLAAHAVRLLGPVEGPVAVAAPRRLAAREGRNLHAARRAARSGGRRFCRLAQPALGEVGGVGETGGLAPDDPYAGTAVASRGQLLDLALLERRRRRAPVLGEHLGEVASGAEGHAEHALENGFVDHRSPVLPPFRQRGPNPASSPRRGPQPRPAP